MSRLSWDDIAKRSYTFGVDRGVFYPKGDVGYAWNGLVEVSESIDDISQSLIYIDGVGHQNQILLGNYAAVLSAMTYPKEFEPFDGYSETYTAQRRSSFDLCYRTMQANDHYQIHLVYNALATPTDRANSSVNAGNTLEPFVWDITTRTELIPGAKASSHFVIDSMFVYPGVMDQIESVLYGNDISSPTMPTTIQLLEFFDTHAMLKITDNGDGTWTAEGSDDVVKLLDLTTFQINWESAMFTDPDTYTVRTL